jgi:flagellar basal-body rod modification protein FlgD
MDVTALSSQLSSSSSSTSSSATGGQALGRDTFLTLLTTQLQNQDPSQPVSNEEFIAQLATFTSVEELMGLRQVMEAASAGIAALNNASMANLLGTEVTAVSDRFRVGADGDVVLHFDAATDATGAVAKVYDEDGSLVASFELGAIEAGEGTYTWDGRGLDGARLPEGTYRVEYEATGADGSSVPVDPLLVGVVDEMDYTTGTPQPSVAGVPVSIGDILRLQRGGG